MVILVGNWKKADQNSCCNRPLIAVFAAAMPLVTGLLYEHVPAISSWFQDEQPSGNPMRGGETVKRTHSSSCWIQFVLSCRNFIMRNKGGAGKALQGV